MIRTFRAVLIGLLLSFAVFSQASQPGTARSHFEEGVKLLREGSFEAALASFERSAALEPKQPATFANIGEIFIRLHRFDKAEAAFRTAIALEPTRGPLHSALCRALSLQKKHQAAIAACEEAVRLEPDSEFANVARISARRAAGAPAGDVRRLIDAAVGRFRDAEVVLALASDFYIERGEYQYAASLLESLISMRPESAVYHGIIAEVFLRLERDTEALASARTALRLEPKNPYGNFAMGMIFYELGQLEEAVASFSKVSQAHPRFDIARQLTARSESKNGRYSVAAEILRKLVSEYPANPDHLYQLGVALSEHGSWAEAASVLSKAHALKPENADIMMSLGGAYLELAEFDKGIGYFEELLRMKPDNEFYKMILGVSRDRQALLPQLPSVLAKADRDPKNARLQLDAVRALAYLKRSTAVEKYASRINDLDPANAEIFGELGVALHEAGFEAKAVEAYLRSLKKKENITAYANLALVYKKKGEFQSSAEAFKRLIELKPETPNFIKAYADLLRDHGHRREALDMYKRSLAQLPLNGPALFEAGLLSLKLGERDAARTYLTTLRTVDPDLAKSLSRCIASGLW